jgi:hypothetical protein
MAKKKDDTQSKAVELFGSKTDVVPAHLQTEAPLGNENVTSGDLAVPRLNLLQAISEEIRTVEGAKAGLIYNTVTGELYETVNLINLFFLKDYAIFKKRKLGGGLEGNFPSAAEAQAHLASLSHPDDYDIVDTDKHYCLLLDEKGQPSSPVLIYMSGSKLKVSKNWNADIQLKGRNTDRFAGVWNLSSVTETNKRNEAYENFDVEFMGWAGEELYAAAKQAYQGFATEIRQAA